MIFRDADGNEYYAGFAYQNCYNATMQKMITQRLKVMPLAKKEVVDGQTDSGMPGAVDREDVPAVGEHSISDATRIELGNTDEQPAQPKGDDSHGG